MRGLPLRSWFEVPLPDTVVHVSVFGELSLDDNLEIFSDGSGGESSSDPVLRRCGFAWVQLDSSGKG